MQPHTIGLSAHIEPVKPKPKKRVDIFVVVLMLSLTGISVGTLLDIAHPDQSTFTIEEDLGAE